MIEPLAIEDNNLKQTQEELKLKLVNDNQLIKSQERVKHQGEVFTPSWMVKKMLSEPAIQDKIHDLHATFLEPSAGNGAFLTEILHQKLSYVDSISSKSNWQINAIWALMSIYGIELMLDNVKEARQFMLNVVMFHYQSFYNKALSPRTDFYKSAKFVITTNIVQGNALTYMTNAGTKIQFSDWQQVDDKHVKRETFTYKSLFDDSQDDNEMDEQLSLFDLDVLESQPKKITYAACSVVKVYKELKND